MISNGMYVISSRSGDRRGAATITWLSQASFKPPLIMAAIRSDSNVFACLSESRIAAVHMLGSHQKDLARKFLATTEVENGTINGEPFVDGSTSAPVFLSSPAHVECQVRDLIDSGGDHVLVIMEVVDATYREDAPPLLIANTPWKYGG